MLALFVKYTIMTSVILLMVGVGLSTPFGQVVAVAKRFQLVARGLVANFIVSVLLIYLSILWLPISPDINIGINFLVHH